jgi:hypothetical protein
MARSRQLEARSIELSVGYFWRRHALAALLWMLAVDLGTVDCGSPPSPSFVDRTEVREGAPCGDWSDGTTRFVVQCDLSRLTCQSAGTLNNGSEIAICVQKGVGCGNGRPVSPLEACSSGFRCVGDLLEGCGLVFDAATGTAITAWTEVRQCNPGTCTTQGAAPFCMACPSGEQCGDFDDHSVCLLPCTKSADCVGPFQVCAPMGCNFLDCSSDIECPADAHCEGQVCQQGAGE